MSDHPEPARLIVTVSAGLIPGKVDHQSRWTLTSAQVGDRVKLAETIGAAMIETLSLQDPQRFNWVTHEWVWL